MKSTYKINAKEVKGVTLYTKDGVFEIENLSNIENYPQFAKDRTEKIVSNILNKVGILKFLQGDKEVRVDLTHQKFAPRFETFSNQRKA
ncbi:hypothetical protein [Alkaliphilus sp. B6464]|uniref:hypothetical protein n=1 Tax=Alkaliphilus sp. B6464 TaxID=2731219 RepID=UPI001BAA0E62|nr:hypothetical protein [Alkaliphilus sp. B6464]QUH22061.1 hypothetical protein HYG84_19335 [Alkaliphilus sp. B6464]